MSIAKLASLYNIPRVCCCKKQFKYQKTSCITSHLCIWRGYYSAQINNLIGGGANNKNTLRITHLAESGDVLWIIIDYY